MLRRLGIRAKVMAVLAVPMIVIFGTGAFISYTALTQLRSAQAAQGVIEALHAYAPMSRAIEHERTLTLTGFRRLPRPDTARGRLRIRPRFRLMPAKRPRMSQP